VKSPTVSDFTSCPNGIGIGGSYGGEGCPEKNGGFSSLLSDDLKYGETHKTLTFEGYEGSLASGDKFGINLIELIRVRPKMKTAGVKGEELGGDSEDDV